MNAGSTWANLFGVPMTLVKRSVVSRDTVIPIVSRLAPFPPAFGQRLAELGIAYPGSPIVEGAGKRYFDDSRGGGQGIRSRFLLLIDDDQESSTKTAAQELGESFSDIEVKIVPELRHNPCPTGWLHRLRDAPWRNPTLASLRSVLDRQQANQPHRSQHRSAPLN